MEMRFVISLNELHATAGQWQFELLEHYGIGVDYVIYSAFKYNAYHVVPCEREWFNHYFDLTHITERWYSMQGNKRATATMQGLIDAFLNVFFEAYTLYFRTFKSVLGYYGVESGDENVFNNPRMSACRFPDRATIDMTILLNQSVTTISSI